MENYKHQINVFVGRQSYILRTNDESEIKAFTGLEKPDMVSVVGLLKQIDSSVSEPTIKVVKEKAVPASNSAGAKCKNCGSDCWDNRENKKNPKSPDYRCKDKKCNSVAWIKKDGGLSWREGLPF